MRVGDEPSFYNEYIRRHQGDTEEDRIRKILACIKQPVSSMLDVGCGRGTLLGLCAKKFSPERLAGVDIAPDTPRYIGALGFEGHACDASHGLPFDDASFDLVICGEVIEHVIDVDRLVAELYRVLRPGGQLVLTTPNLAYIPNRLLLLLGIQPLFTETSVQRNLGRFWHFLGQDGDVQHHLKIFTCSALRELITHAGFVDCSFAGYRFFQHGLLRFADALLTIRPAFAAGFILNARKPKANI